MCVPASTWKAPSKSKQLVQWLSWNRREMRQWSIAELWLGTGGSGALAIRCSGLACWLALLSVLMLVILLSTFLFGHDMLELNTFYLVLVSLGIKYPLPNSSTTYQQQCAHTITGYNPLWDLRHCWHSPCHRVGLINMAEHACCSSYFCCACPVLQDLAIMGMGQAVLGEKNSSDGGVGAVLKCKRR